MGRGSTTSVKMKRSFSIISQVSNNTCPGLQVKKNASSLAKSQTSKSQNGREHFFTTKQYQSYQQLRQYHQLPRSSQQPYLQHSRQQHQQQLLLAQLNHQRSQHNFLASSVQLFDLSPSRLLIRRNYRRENRPPNSNMQQHSPKQRSHSRPDKTIISRNTMTISMDDPLGYHHQQHAERNVPNHETRPLQQKKRKVEVIKSAGVKNIELESEKDYFIEEKESSYNPENLPDSNLSRSWVCFRPKNPRPKITPIEKCEDPFREKIRRLTSSIYGMNNVFNTKLFTQSIKEENNEEVHHPLGKQIVQKKKDEEMVVMSYNILARHLAFDHSWLYTYCPHQYLDWNHRKSTIMKEMIEWKSDIMCLQEVVSFERWLMSSLREFGYTGWFKQRTGGNTDGCAIIYNRNKYVSLEYIPVEYKVEGSRLLNRDNVGQVAVLKHRRTGNIVIVGNTHLAFNPIKGDVKIAQLNRLIRSMQDAQSRYKDAAVVVCGDFNATPQSLLLKDFVLSGAMRFSREKNTIVGPNPRHVSGQLKQDSNPQKAKWSYDTLKEMSPLLLGDIEDDPSEEPDRYFVTHNLNLSSAYSKYSELFSKKLYTTNHNGFSGIVDYILSCPKTTCTGLLVLTEDPEPWPSKNIPSDHQPLVAKFKYV